MQQINLVIGVILASLLPTGAVSYLYYADRVYQLPLGVIGIAVGTALLPLLSRQIREGDEAGGRESFNRALEFSLLLTLPAAAALMAMPGPIVAVLFERGAFDAGATAATAAALAAFATGLPAFVLVKVLAPAFFAREDVTTPVKIAGVSVAANIALSVALLGPLQHVGLALATSAASWLNAFLLAFVLHRRGQFATDRRLRTRLLRIVLATAAMTAVLLAGIEALASPVGGHPARAGTRARPSHRRRQGGLYGRRVRPRRGGNRRNSRRSRPAKGLTAPVDGGITPPFPPRAGLEFRP